MASAGLSAAVTGVLGSSVVERAVAASTAGQLRILAYHGIPDPGAFARQLDHLRDLYHPVSGAEVIAAIAGRARLPRRSVWVTFDDGRPEVVTDGLPLLVERAIPATMYVCPGVVDTREPYWWDVVELAERHGARPSRWTPPAGVPVTTALKRIPDAERRAVITELTDSLGAAGVDVSVRQITSPELHRWRDAGMEVANHTWDHPLLDMCDDAEQVRQVERAHEALTAVAVPTSFAYPNGNVTEASRACIRRIGYSTGVDFAHRLCSRRADPLVLPRLRIDTDAPLPRFRAIASGAHSAAFGLGRGRHGRNTGAS